MPLCVRHVWLLCGLLEWTGGFLSPRGLLLDLKGNYTELIKKMSQMKSIKVMFHM